jgi:hypothetical protein
LRIVAPDSIEEVSSVNNEILEKLKVITEEEQEILNGREEIDNRIYMNQATNIVDRHKLLEKGRFIQIRPHTRFIHFPPHSHNYIEIVYMCKGRTRHVINGDDIMLEKGELLFLNQNAIQEIYPADKDDIAVNFIVLPEFFDVAIQMMEEKENLL